MKQGVKAYFMCVCAEWDTKSPCETEIRQLQVPLIIDQQILWLQVTMQHPMRMTILDPRHKLQHELLDHILAQAQCLQPITCSLRKRFTPSSSRHRKRFHVFLEIEVEEFKDEVEFVAVGVDNVEEAHDVHVVHFFEEGDFADGGRGDAFVFGFETDLFERDNAVVG